MKNITLSERLSYFFVFLPFFLKPPATLEPLINLYASMGESISCKMKTIKEKE